MEAAIVKNIMSFMGRVPLKGNEVNAFNEAMNALLDTQKVDSENELPLEKAIEEAKEKDAPDPDKVFAPKDKKKGK